jgi:hypothetical protein
MIAKIELQGLFVAAVMPVLLCWHMPERKVNLKNIMAKFLS